jgi:hypothetical protein
MTYRVYVTDPDTLSDHSIIASNFLPFLLKAVESIGPKHCYIVNDVNYDVVWLRNRHGVVLVDKIFFTLAEKLGK